MIAIVSLGIFNAPAASLPATKHNAEYYLAEADHFLLVFDYRSAIEAMEKALTVAKPTEKLQVYLRLSSWLINTSQFARAELLLQEAQRDYPRSSELFSQQASLYLETNRLELSVKAIAEALRINPHNPDANYQTASFYGDQSIISKAIEGYQAAIISNPQGRGVGELYDQLGKCFIMAGRIPDALRAFSLALQKAPYLSRTYISLGAINTAEGDFAAAETLYNRSIELNPFHPSAYHNLGVLFMTKFQVLGKQLSGKEKGALLSAAEKAFKKEVALNERSSEGRIGLGMVFLEGHRFEEAEQVYQAVYTLGFKNAAEYFGVAARFIEKGEIARAKRWFRVAYHLFQEAQAVEFFSQKFDALIGRFQRKKPDLYRELTSLKTELFGEK